MNFKFNPTGVKPQTPIEVSDVQKVSEPQTIRSEIRAHASGEFAEFEAQAAMLRNDITDVIATGLALRTEAEGFVAWCRTMGEDVDSKTWGPTQADYAANWRLRHRAMAARFKTQVEAQCQQPQNIMAYLFGDKTRGQHDSAVTKAAREELGI